MLFVSPARLTGGDEIAVRVYWEKLELVLKPLTVKPGFRATLERVRWLKEEGVTVNFEDLGHLELTTPHGQDVGMLTVQGDEETYKLVLPAEAARRVMGLWMAVKLRKAP